MFFIYKITNIKNNKIYIGQTNNPYLRWHQHKSNAKYNKGKQIITKAISKYGANNFVFEVIATCDTQANTDKTEINIIDQYNSRNLKYGYNLAIGGNTRPWTPEISKKISNALKKYYKTHSSWNKGGTLSEEWKNKISKASFGKPGTNIGKKFSNEHINKISKSLLGKKYKSQRRFSENTEMKICKLYTKNKLSAYALSKKFDCFSSLIFNILKRNNIKIRKSNYTGHCNNCNIFSAKQEKEICKLYLNDISKTNLAKRFNCRKNTIRRVLLKNNIKEIHG